MCWRVCSLAEMGGKDTHLGLREELPVVGTPRGADIQKRLLERSSVALERDAQAEEYQHVPSAVGAALSPCAEEGGERLLESDGLRRKVRWGRCACAARAARKAHLLVDGSRARWIHTGLRARRLTQLGPYVLKERQRR